MTRLALATLAVAALVAVYLWAINATHADLWDEYEVQP